MRESNGRSNGVTVALIYTRVSTDEQAREGLSLAAQLVDTRRYVANQGWVIGGEFQDTLTGRRDDRPQYQALLADVRRLRGEGKAVAVVVKWLDRFGRSVLERAKCAKELRGLGVPLHSVMEGGAVNDFVYNILAAVAEEESRKLGERVSEVAKHVIANGWHPVGAAPLGYRWRDATDDERKQGAPKKVLEEDPLTAPSVREAFRRAAEGETIQKVARWFMALPAASRRNLRMSYQSTRFVLRCPTYVALSWPQPSGSRPMYHGGATKTEGVQVPTPGHWPALVDETTWRIVQERTVNHRYVHHQASGRHLLTGFLRCPNCGCAMVGVCRTEKERLQNKRDSYNCRGIHYLGAAAPNPNCHASVVKEPIDNAVLAEVARVLDAFTSSTEFRPALERAWRAIQDPQGREESAREIGNLKREAERARRRLADAARKLVDGDLDKAGYELLRDEQQDALREIEARLIQLEVVKPARVVPPLDQVLRDVGDWGEILRGVDTPKQRDVLAQLIESVRPRRPRRGSYEVEITWRPLGEALRALADGLRAS